jgi:hypothetical protein
VSGFGDSEPEDAWHPDDPPTDLIRNLIRRRDRDRDNRDLEELRRVMFDEDLAWVLHRVAELEERGT